MAETTKGHSRLGAVALRGGSRSAELRTRDRMPLCQCMALERSKYKSTVDGLIIVLILLICVSCEPHETLIFLMSGIKEPSRGDAYLENISDDTRVKSQQLISISQQASLEAKSDPYIFVVDSLWFIASSKIMSGFGVLFERGVAIELYQISAEWSGPDWGNVGVSQAYFFRKETALDAFRNATEMRVAAQGCIVPAIESDEAQAAGLERSPIVQATWVGAAIVPSTYLNNVTYIRIGP